MRVMSRAMIALGAALVAVTAGWVAPARAVAASCPVYSAQTWLPSPGLDGWAENLLVADGSVWISRTLRNVIERYDDSGRLRASTVVNAPGSIRQGPDGMVYVASGDSTVNMIPGAPRTGAVVRLDPHAAQPIAQVFAPGLGMPNGLVVEPDGTVFVADGVLGLLRLRADGSIDTQWSARAPQNLAPTPVIDGTGMNGLVAVGDDLFLTMTMSSTGRVLQVPIDNPAATGSAADLTAPVPAILDDLAAVDSTTLAVASAAGQVHFVDLRGHRVCSSSVGYPLTALAIVRDRPGELLATSETGQVITLRRR